jgi:hypothetical protein
MRKALFLSILALCAAPVAAADSGHCDATPFTLGKPAAPAPKADKVPSKPPVVAQAEPKKVQPKVQPKAKPTLLAPCKDGKPKSKG